MPVLSRTSAWCRSSRCTSRTWPRLGKLTVVSMHASPKTVPPGVLDRYPGSPPPPRRGGTGTRHGGRLLCSDLPLHAPSEAATRGPVLAAGDLNEARRWDGVNAGDTWGAEFFANVLERGLDDVTRRLGEKNGEIVSSAGSPSASWTSSWPHLRSGTS
jgi:hypothetical protein